MMEKITNTVAIDAGAKDFCGTYVSTVLSAICIENCSTTETLEWTTWVGGSADWGFTPRLGIIGLD